MESFNKNWFLYITSGAVLIFSFLGAYLLPINEIWKGITALPGIGALILALYKSWKDEQLQNKQQDFIFGTTSHMAEVVYDKHAEFCEDYIKKVQEGFHELLKDGASKSTGNIGRELVNVRQKHSAWLTKEIEASLRPFEQALITIGAKEHYLELSKLPIGDKRNKIVDEIFRSLGLILNYEKPLNEDEASLRIDEVIEKIRDILGINTLTKLRAKAITVAFKRLNS